MTAVVTEVAPFDVRRVRSAPGLLLSFNDAGVLVAADVHVATRLAELAGEADGSIVLAAALAVRAPRIGHVLVDLATIRDTATVDVEDPVDLSELPWPEPDSWVGHVAASGLVAAGEDAPESDRPLRLVGTWLYLDRYWREEREVAADLRALSEPATDVDIDRLAEGLARLFPGQTDGRQALAAGTALLRRLAVVAGGPGTGKTTTVARIVALLAEQSEATGSSPPLVGLAAPTGKAAARLREAVHEEATKLSVDEPIRDQLLALSASTLHRLLGWRRGTNSRFRYHRGQRLPHDVVIVDETSMVSLSLMARLLEAIRPDARLILVGDPGQLASIEAGAVLGDIVGPATDKPLTSPDTRALLTQATGHEVAAEDPPEGASIADGIVVLNRVHRFGGGIARLAEAIRRGDADAVLDILHEGPRGVTWLPVDVTKPDLEEPLGPIRKQAVAAARQVIEAARAAAAREALEALPAFRLLCAHRRGRDGVSTWTARIESWLADEIPNFPTDTSWYPGRPLIVTENDYELGLYNGDTGVVMQSSPDRPTAAFDRGGEIVEYTPTRLRAVDTVYAMTIHKSQGSQFGTATVLLPALTSQILTRELLYTAVTRAHNHLILAGTADMIRVAVARRVARAAGLQVRLWS